jgi:hypothetical protein
MAKYDISDVFYLDTNLTLGTDFDAGTQVSNVLDISSYVNPIGQGRSKGTGLAIYRVQFSWASSSGNRPVPSAETSAFRAALLAGYDTTQAAAAATDLATNQLSASNDLMIAGIDYYSPSSFAGITTTPTSSSTSSTPFLEPSTEVPYVVVRDSIGLVAVNSINTTAAMKIGVRLSCAIITLNQATLNQLLRTQTV